MTKEEAIALYERIAARQPAMFSGYWKYTFSWSVNCSEGHLLITYGGSADDIYRFEVSGGEMKLPATIQDAKQEDYEVCFTPKGGVPAMWLTTA